MYSTPPRNLDKRTTITIGEKTFEVDADDLEMLCTLGRGAYGVVDKMKHKQSGTIMAVKVMQTNYISNKNDSKFLTVLKYFILFSEDHSHGKYTRTKAIINGFRYFNEKFRLPLYSTILWRSF